MGSLGISVHVSIWTSTFFPLHCFRCQNGALCTSIFQKKLLDNVVDIGVCCVDFLQALCIRRGLFVCPVLPS